MADTTTPTPSAAPPPKPDGKRGPRPVEASESPCTLGREVHFEGTLTASEDLTILGRVTGKIKANGALVVGKEAQTEASIEGQRIMVLGRVKGNIRGTERVELGPSATVYGDIQAPVIQINEGAQFEGRVQRPGKATANGLSRFMGR